MCFLSGCVESLTNVVWFIAVSLLNYVETSAIKGWDRVSFTQHINFLASSSSLFCGYTAKILTIKEYTVSLSRGINILFSI